MDNINICENIDKTQNLDPVKCTYITVSCTVDESPVTEMIITQMYVLPMEIGP